MSDEKRISSALDTLEQLIWLLRGNKIEELEELAKEIKAAQLLKKNAINSRLSKDKNNSANKDFLVGSLPRLFQDLNLFPTNEDIVDFAKNALDIKITRHQKRSRYEIIGLVICETTSLSEPKLDDLVSALEIITASESGIKNLSHKKKLDNFSWNGMIQELLRPRKND